MYILICLWANDKMEASCKKITIWSGILTSILCFLLSFQFIKEITILQMVVLFAMKFIFCCCLTYEISYYLFIFPKPVENVLIGSVEFIGNLGKIMAPVIVRVASSNKQSPLQIFGIIFLIMAVLPAFSLP